MFDRKARIEQLLLRPGRRIIVVSDIHANVPYFRGLMEKIGFSDNDELIIDGDFLEKGESSLEMLHILMKMSARGNTHIVCGNCDDWFEMFSWGAREDSAVLRYILWRKKGLIWDMCNVCGIDPFELDDFAECKKKLFEAYEDEWRFLSHIPHAIETEKFIFAHAGVHADKPLRAHTAGELMKYDDFLNQGNSFSRWVIVGHWPVMLYGEDRVCANPIIDRQHKIISIDGGCVLKDDGQLNALIIPDKNSEAFTWEHYDPFPVRRVLTDQQEGGRSYYIRWGDSRVKVLERGEEFSLCRHERTGYEMRILTKYLFTDNELTDCNDCTDYILPLKEGDTVSVVETTSEGYFVKHDGVSGWYYGELE